MSILSRTSFLLTGHGLLKNPDISSPIYPYPVLYPVLPASAYPSSLIKVILSRASNIYITNEDLSISKVGKNNVGKTDISVSPWTAINISRTSYYYPFLNPATYSCTDDSQILYTELGEFGTAAKYVRQTIQMTPFVTYNVSFYYKLGSSALQFGVSSTNYFNIDNNGTSVYASSVVGTAFSNILIQDMNDDGWFRISANLINPSTTNYSVQISFNLINDNPTSTWQPSYTATGLNPLIYVKMIQVTEGLELLSPSFNPSPTIGDRYPSITYTTAIASGPKISHFPQTTNRLTESSNFRGTAWTKSGLITINSLSTKLSPEKINNAYTITENVITGTHSLVRSNQQILSVNDVYTLSFYVAKIDRQFFRLSISNTTQLDWISAQFDFDDIDNITNFTKGSIFSILETGYEESYDGWYRCYITFRSTSTFTNAIFSLSMSNGSPISITDPAGVASYSGENRSMHVFGAQFEVSTCYDKPSAYIPTTTSMATRTNAFIYSDPNTFSKVIYIDGIIRTPLASGDVSVLSGGISIGYMGSDGVSQYAIEFIYTGAATSTNDLYILAGDGHVLPFVPENFKVAIKVDDNIPGNVKVFINGVYEGSFFIDIIDDGKLSFTGIGGPFPILINSISCIGDDTLNGQILPEITDAALIQLTTL
jgi:hypothetical protein